MMTVKEISKNSRKVKRHSCTLLVLSLTFAFFIFPSIFEKKSEIKPKINKIGGKLIIRGYKTDTTLVKPTEEVKILIFSIFLKF